MLLVDGLKSYASKRFCQLSTSFVVNVAGSVLLGDYEPRTTVMLGCGSSSSAGEVGVHEPPTTNAHAASARVPAAEGAKERTELKVQEVEKSKASREAKAHETEERREEADAQAQEVEEEERE